MESLVAIPWQPVCRRRCSRRACSLRVKLSDGTSRLALIGRTALYIFLLVHEIKYQNEAKIESSEHIFANFSVHCSSSCVYRRAWLTALNFASAHTSEAGGFSPKQSATPSPTLLRALDHQRHCRYVSSPSTVYGVISSPDSLQNSKLTSFSHSSLDLYPSPPTPLPPNRKYGSSKVGTHASVGAHWYVSLLPAVLHIAAPLPAICIL